MTRRKDRLEKKKRWTEEDGQRSEMKKRTQQRHLKVWDRLETQSQRPNFHLAFPVCKTKAFGYCYQFNKQTQ